MRVGSIQQGRESRLRKKLFHLEHDKEIQRFPLG
jgi:hypothetical protein